MSSRLNAKHSPILIADVEDSIKAQYAFLLEE
jgi:hypothetical protein